MINASDVDVGNGVIGSQAAKGDNKYDRKTVTGYGRGEVRRISPRRRRREGLEF